MDDIFLTVDLFPRPQVRALVRENGPNSPARLCDVRCQMVREHFATLPFAGRDPEGYRAQKLANFLADADRLQRVLDGQTDALLGESDRKAASEHHGDLPGVDERNELANVLDTIDRVTD